MIQNLKMHKILLIGLFKRKIKNEINKFIILLNNIAIYLNFFIFIEINFVKKYKSKKKN